MGAGDRIGLAGRLESLAAVLAQSLQDGIARPLACRQVRDRERLVDQPRQQVEHGLVAREVGPADRFARVEVEAVSEDAQPPEEHPLGLAKEVVAPVDRRAERPLTRQGRAAPAGQDPEAVLEAGEEVVESEDVDPGGRELDRQRDAIEPATDTRDHLGVVIGQGEAGPLSRRAVAEQLDRFVASSCRGRGRTTRVRGRERRDAPGQLARDAERLTARGEDPQTGSVAEEAIDQLGRDLDDVLAVVQDHQRPLGGDMLGDRVRQRPSRDVADTEGGGDGRRDERRIRQRRQIDEPDTVIEGLEQVGSGLQSEPRLPGPAGPDERHETMLAHEVGHGRQVGCPADEARQLGREVMPERVEGGERREGCRQGRVLELEDALGSGQVPQSMLAEVAQRSIRRQLVADERRGGRRNQDLPTMRQ